MKIAAHTLVKNEDRFLWYSVTSVIEHIDKMYLWDTGSTDSTIKIAKELKKIYGDRIDLKLLGEVTPSEFARVRGEMLTATKEDWFLVVDGDEIWWEESIKKVIEEIKLNGEKLESIVVPTVNVIADMFHYQDPKAGKYQLADKKGHLALRAVNRKIPGLGSSKPHGTWGWTDKEGKMIQDRDVKKIKFIDAPYIHTTFLQRSSKRQFDLAVPKRAKKLKYELGISFPLDFYYPEAFFVPRPEFVPSVWDVADKRYFSKALIQTPLKKIKRKMVKSKVGY